MEPTAKRLVCINPKMLSPELVSVVMALSAQPTLSGNLPNEVAVTTNSKDSNGGNGLATIKKEKDKKKDKEDKREKKEDKEAWDLKLDITREFRCTHFPMIYAMLQNPLSELLSNVAPIHVLNSIKDEHVNIIGAPVSPKDATGWLFLFNDPTANYSHDGIEWQTAKMSVKLIVANQATGTYKLKNNRADEGLVVMRRQTWQGKKTIPGRKGEEENGKSVKTWRKHEYKLVQREKFYKTNPDGSIVVDQLQRIVDFPVLVHYFIKTVDVNRVNRKRKAKDDEECDEIFEKEELTDSRPPTKVPMLAHHASPATSLALSLSQQNDFPNPLHLSLESTMPSFLDNSFELLPDEFRLCNFASVPIPVASPLNITAKVKSYAPEGGAWEDTTKVLLVVEGFAPSDKNTYSVRFGDLEVPATEVTTSVIEFHAPANHSPGIAYFWVVCRHASAAAEYSNPVPFFYYPADQQGHLRLDFKVFTENNFISDDSAERRGLVNRFKYFVRELDISNNNLDDLEFLGDLSKLQTLIADNNKLTHNSNLPSLPNLKTFSVNYNSITNLEIFLDNIQVAFPNLTYLSLIHNEACPYFSKMAHHYYNYRIYVISRIPSLLYLDSSIVTSEEHRHASCIMTDSLVAL